MTTTDKVKKIQTLLASESSSIELHDYIIEEVRCFLSATSEDNFCIEGKFSQDELLERISRYEDLCNDLAILTACIAYWAKPSHKKILQKVLARSTDRLEPQRGLTIWINLRWYPIIVVLYCAGIAAIEGKRYDSLANIFYTLIGSSEYKQQDEFFIEAVANIILKLKRNEIFKQLPGYENNYVPMSEYLFKTLKPKLDDILFIGKDYERSFDEFEVLFALAAKDVGKQCKKPIGDPIGRFGWKQREYDNAPLSRIIKEAHNKGNNWEPIKQGLFGGDFKRFTAVADEYQQNILQLNW